VDLFFVRTSDPAAQVPIELPAGMQLEPADSRSDTYIVSPDGQWIAGTASKSPSGTIAVILVNIADPTVVHTATPSDAIFAGQLQFSRDSQHLYFLAGVPSVGTDVSVYRTALAMPDQSTLVSATPSGVFTDTVTFYTVLADQSKVLLRASRGGVTNVYYVSTTNLRNEIKLNHALDPGDELIVSQVGGIVTGPDITRIGYFVRPTVGQVRSYVAEISATSNPRPVGAPGLSFAVMRPDNQAVLLESSEQIFEALVDSAQPPQLVCDGFNARYDSRGEAVTTQVFNPVTPTNPEEYLSVAAAVRPTFGTTRQVGSPDKAAHFSNFTGGDRAIVLIGEGPKFLFPPLPTFRMALVNVWAPDKLIYLADFVSPINLRSGRALVVDP
jgi:hypothetical protein